MNITTRGRAVTVAALAAAALIGTMPGLAAAAPSPVYPGPGPISTTMQAQYKVTAEAFRTIDESGPDWPGADEPYFIFSSEGAKNTEASRRTNVFGDVDSGESRTFTGSNRCVFPTNCGTAAAPNGIGLSAQMWEEDNGDAAAVLAKMAEYFTKAKPIVERGPVPWAGEATGYMAQGCKIVSGWLEDDLLGTQTWALSKAQLDAYLPHSGDSFMMTKFFGDSGHQGVNTPGYHSVRFTVSRTDVRVPLVLSNPGTIG